MIKYNKNPPFLADQRFKIFYFDFHDSSNKYNTSKLRLFLRFIQTYFGKDHFNFRYTQAGGELIGHLSLIENVLLGANNLGVENENSNQQLNNLQQQIQEMSNCFIKELFHSITNWNMIAKHSSSKEQHLASLIKGLISDEKLVYLENPFNSNCRGLHQIIQKALLFETYHKNKMLFIRPNLKDLNNIYLDEIITHKVKFHPFGHTIEEVQKNYSLCQVIPLTKILLRPINEPSKLPFEIILPKKIDSEEAA